MRRLASGWLLFVGVGCHLAAGYSGAGSDRGPTSDMASSVDRAFSTDAATDGAVWADATVDGAVAVDAPVPDAPVSDAPVPDAPVSDAPVSDAPVDGAVPADAALPLLMISELLIDPKGADPAGEWIELHNPGAGPVSLDQWQLRDNFGVLLIDQPLSVPPGGYVVLAAHQAGVVADLVYDAITCGSQLCLANDGDLLELYDPSGALIDRVDWSGGWASVGEGASISVISPALDNALPSSWCAETATYPPKHKDYGSPGAPPGC